VFAVQRAHGLLPCHARLRCRDGRAFLLPVGALVADHDKPPEPARQAGAAADRARRGNSRARGGPRPPATAVATAAGFKVGRTSIFCALRPRVPRAR
jgi:hypothetical protein